MTATELATRHYDDVAQKFADFGPEEAEDLTQETFARLTGALGAADNGTPTLLNRIAWGVRIDRIRKNYREESQGPARAIPWGTPWQQEFSSAFDQAIRELPEQERDALILMELRGATADEAAAQLGVSRRTFWRRHQAALESLRKELA